MTPEGVAVVESGDPDDLTVAADRTLSSAGHVRTQRVGRIGPVRISAVQQMPDSIDSLNSNAGTRLVRNLLIECGIKCRIRRSGDTNVRMDGVLATAEGRLGVLEIELGNAALESPRELLEDVAVLHSRHGIEVGSIDPVSVITKLPNARSEYFRVMSDIEKVLTLRCRTVTVGALLAVERLRAEFLGMVSHELRTPLTSIKSSAATLTEAASDLDPAEMLQFFRIIGEQADHTRDLIGDLLDMARIETGELAVAPGACGCGDPGGRGQEQVPERRGQEQPPHRPLAGAAAGHGGWATDHPGPE